MGFLRSWFFYSALNAFLLVVLTLSLTHPFMNGYDSPLSTLHPLPHLPHFGLQQLYHDPRMKGIFTTQDSATDWSSPLPSVSIFNSLAHFMEFIALQLPGKITPAPLRLLQLLQGPAHVQALRTATLLGIPDLLSNKALSLKDLHKAILANEKNQAQYLAQGLLLNPKETLPSFAKLPISKLERLMNFLLSFGYFTEATYAGSHIYAHNANSVVLKSDHPTPLVHALFHFGHDAYLAWHNHFHAIITPEDEGSVSLEGDYTAVTKLDAISGLDSLEFIRSGKSEYKGPALSGTKPTTQNTQQATPAEIQHLRSLVASPRGSKETGSSSKAPNAYEITFKKPFWQLRHDHPPMEINFAHAMTELDALSNNAIVADYKWDTRDGAPVASLIDVGGSFGSFLSKILEGYPGIPAATLFDLNEMAAAAKPLWSKTDAKGKHYALASTRDVSVVAGDFFQAQSIPAPSTKGATKYVLRQILHDWSDLDAMRILTNIRTKVGSAKDVSVVVVEMNRNPLEMDSVRPWVDAHMMVSFNSCERTPLQWDTITRVSGWKIHSTTPTRSLFQVIELRPDEFTATPAAPAANKPQQPQQPQKQQQQHSHSTHEKQEL